MVGFDDLGTGPHPVLVVGGGQLVEVDDDVPVRRIAAIAVQRCPPPQPSWVAGVAPEVVQELAATADVWYARIRVEHLERVGTHPLEAFPG